jgi:hypothetical protein
MQSLCNQSVTRKMSWLVGRVAGVMINAPHITGSKKRGGCSVAEAAPLFAARVYVIVSRSFSLHADLIVLGMLSLIYHPDG